MKYMTKKKCAGCGAEFEGGPRAEFCRECAAVYRRRWTSAYRRQYNKGVLDREALRSEALAAVRAWNARREAPAVKSFGNCRYCGKELGARDAGKHYCAQCIKLGLHWLHEVTGRTARGGA